MNDGSGTTRPEFGYRARRGSLSGMAGYTAIGAATAVTLLMVLAPLGSAGFKAIVIKAPYKGTVYGGPNSLATNGCGGTAALSKVGAFTLSTGKLLESATATSKVCGLYGFPTYTTASATDQAGMIGGAWTMSSTGYHTNSAQWKTTYTFTLNNFLGNKSQYVYTSVQLYITGELWNVTGNKWAAYGTSFSNTSYSYNNNRTFTYPVTSHIYTIYANTTLYNGITYEWITGISISVSTQVLNSGSSTSTATVNMATSGQSATLVQEKVI
ncbi:MAG: hypothetical protein ACHQ2Y_01875 [Candidatus Lutacidiplasmatales archaeon]